MNRPDSPSASPVQEEAAQAALQGRRELVASLALLVVRQHRRLSGLATRGQSAPSQAGASRVPAGAVAQPGRRGSPEVQGALPSAPEEPA
jgi:hypothetical protein